MALVEAIAAHCVMLLEGSESASTARAGSPFGAESLHLGSAEPLKAGRKGLVRYITSTNVTVVSSKKANPIGYGEPLTVREYLVESLLHVSRQVAPHEAPGASGDSFAVLVSQRVREVLLSDVLGRVLTALVGVRWLPGVQQHEHEGRNRKALMF